MEVIPGIDLMAGRCVCAIRNPYALDTRVQHDPVEIAKAWADQGAKRLYIADLDGARMGSPQNLHLVQMIMDATGIPVIFGGGIRTVQKARMVLDAGVDRVVVGTTAALEASLAKEILAAVGDRTIVSVASLNGYVAVRDWQARTEERAEDFAKRMCALGAGCIAYNDVSRKGMRGGMNLPALRRLVSSLNAPVIASGGLSNIDEIVVLKELGPQGLEGVVVVSALYSGVIQLPDAIAAAL